nr:retrovirus-related Pol polyprotein from transposon TNT 1-94 [Tanacetum cinerariifolium]
MREALRLHRYKDPPESPVLCKEFVQWKKAINEEMISLKKPDLVLSQITSRKEGITEQVVFKVKEEQDGKKRYKARLIVKGFQQKQGADYNEIFSSVMKMTTISKKQAPKTMASRRRMAKVPYSSTVGNVMLLHVSARKEVVLEGFSDSDYGGFLDLGKITMGYVFTVSEAGKKFRWLKNFLEELDSDQTKCVLFYDNQSAIHIAKNPVFHGRTKHIKISYHVDPF